MRINRINPPAWARPVRVRNEGVSNEAMIRMQAAGEALLSVVHTEVSAYLSDPALTFDSADDFPSTRRLTGEYYIGDQRYDTDPETGRSRVSSWLGALHILCQRNRTRTITLASTFG